MNAEKDYYKILWCASMDLDLEEQHGARFELKLLVYSLDHELLMDIMKYGQDVRVVEPEDLKKTIQLKHQQAADMYYEQGSLKL